MHWKQKPLEYFNAVDELAKTISTMASLEVEVRLQKGAGLGFWVGGKKFAQVNPTESWTVIYTGVKKEFAIKAGVANSANGEKKNGWHNEDDELYWHTNSNAGSALRATAAILAKVCQAR
jgi:hypothetical protein